MATITAQPTREDYERAARAAGIGGAWDDDAGCWQLPNGEIWDAYNNSADAFRLMVACGITPMPYPVYKFPKHSVIAKQNRLSDTLRERNPTETVELYGDDPEAATRHAIFWCAAAIGKQMREKK